MHRKISPVSSTVFEGSTGFIMYSTCDPPPSRWAFRDRSSDGETHAWLEDLHVLQKMQQTKITFELGTFLLHVMPTKRRQQRYPAIMESIVNSISQSYRKQEKFRAMEKGEGKSFNAACTSDQAPPAKLPLLSRSGFTPLSPRSISPVKWTPGEEFTTSLWSLRVRFTSHPLLDFLYENQRWPAFFRSTHQT